MSPKAMMAMVLTSVLKCYCSRIALTNVIPRSRYGIKLSSKLVARSCKIPVARRWLIASNYVSLSLMVYSISIIIVSVIWLILWTGRELSKPLTISSAPPRHEVLCWQISCKIFRILSMRLSSLNRPFNLTISICNNPPILLTRVSFSSTE